MKNIFKGIKIIEVAKVFSGPFAARMFADYGAEVIKVEHGTNFDDTRHFQPIKDGWSGYYEILNRNKRGVALNLKDPKDLEKLHNLVKEADVFVENLTPSTKYKLKIDYETLKAKNPHLIYASLSGVGQDTDRKYYDVIAQAQSGLLSLSGTKKTPIKIGPAVVDAFSGMTLAFGIASALFYREKTGKGQNLSVSMLSSAMNLLENNLIEYSVTNKSPMRPGNQDNSVSPFGVYRTKDGYVAVAAGNDKLWGVLSKFLRSHSNVIFAEELFTTNTLRLKNQEMLTGIIEQVFSSYTSRDLESKLNLLEVPCSRVYEMSDVAAEEDNFKRKALISLDHSKLGKVVIPGKSIHFSESDNFPITEAPSIGKDNKKYGI
jgi:CoA:oxalate CoA-transferase